MKRALVTGGSGFLGSYIADELLESGFSVRVFDRDSSPYLRTGQEMVSGDIRDPKQVLSAADGCDVVFHLAALADLNKAHGAAIEAAEHNILGTVHALEAARAVEATRFVLASTVYVYSRAGGFYRCSKQAAESFVEEYSRQFALPFTILRYGSLYGPRSDESNGVYRLLAAAMKDGRVVHSGTPDDIREYVHVQDAARLSVEALDDDFIDRHVTITGTHPMRLKDLLVMFEEILSTKLAIDYRGDSGHDGQHYRMTPYAYMPRVGRKLTSRHYVDMGQGILELVHEIDKRATGSGAETEPD